MTDEFKIDPDSVVVEKFYSYVIAPTMINHGVKTEWHVKFRVLPDYGVEFSEYLPTNEEIIAITDHAITPSMVSSMVRSVVAEERRRREQDAWGVNSR